MLNAGGNAFDAFVAATFAEYVVNEGGTSLAGSLGALIYDGKTGDTKYLDAEFNRVLDVHGAWNSGKPWGPDDPESGKAVLVPGAAAPKLVTRAMLPQMRPGSVLVDVAIDQGGCFESSRATTHSDPTYIVDNVVHYCVANMPGAVARTSTYALTWPPCPTP